VAKFKHEPNGEVSGVYRNGETWLVKFDANGIVNTGKDEEIDATLTDLAALPDHPIRAVKG
jgi:hypothetical protein